MYQFNENYNYKARFWFEKKLIDNMNWALLPKSSKAIFPVIACHVNEKGESFPSERTIAILSGLSDKVVREGIRGLEGFPGFRCFYYITQRGKRGKKFQVKLPIENHKGRAFPFFRMILEGGNWRKLKPSAKALYPVMRRFGYFDTNFYGEMEGLEISEEGFGEMSYEEIYRDREYDFCEAEINVMAEYSGISRRSIQNALNDLHEKKLIEPLVNCYGWKVFLRPVHTFKMDFLNKEVINSFRYSL